MISLKAVELAKSGTPTPHFAKFLDEVTKGDADLQRFLKQYAGYCLTGITSEQVLLVIYGPGGNGKSVLQNRREAEMTASRDTGPCGTCLASWRVRPPDMRRECKAKPIGASVSPPVCASGCRMYMLAASAA
jgi:hypothetical protein